MLLLLLNCGAKLSTAFECSAIIFWLSASSVLIPYPPFLKKGKLQFPLALQREKSLCKFMAILLHTNDLPPSLPLSLSPSDISCHLVVRRSFVCLWADLLLLLLPPPPFFDVIHPIINFRL